MTRAASPPVGALTEILLADRLLQDGEVILLTVKPSRWFIVLSSLSVWLAVLGLGLVLLAVEAIFAPFTMRDFHLVATALLAAVLLQAVLAGFRWLGRLYVLTNRRVMRIGGVLRVAVADCPLERIDEVLVEPKRDEALLGLATIDFHIHANPYAELSWSAVPRAREVAEEIRRAIKNAPTQRGEN